MNHYLLHSQEIDLFYDFSHLLTNTGNTDKFILKLVDGAKDNGFF